MAATRSWEQRRRPAPDETHGAVANQARACNGPCTQAGASHAPQMLTRTGAAAFPTHCYAVFRSARGARKPQGPCAWSSARVRFDGAPSPSDLWETAVEGGRSGERLWQLL
eukprot:354960-Chlamydomonas_euryale.AAC.3